MCFLVYYTHIAGAYGSYNSRGIMGHDPHTSYSACVVYTKTIIHLSVGESGGYLPSRKAAREISTTIHLHFGE